MVIAYYGISSAHYGGALHEKMALDALREEHSVIWYEMKKSAWIPGDFPSYFPYLWRHHPHADVTLFHTGSLPLVNLKNHRKKILFFHHYNPSIGRAPWFHRKYQERMLRLVEKMDVVTVLGEYWRAFIAQYARKTVEVVYTPFEVPLHPDALEEKVKLRKELGLPTDGRKIIYVGGVTRAKGADLIYRALGGNKKYFLVGSGEKEPDIPIACILGNYQNYLKLLYASDVTLCFSRLSEGWNRIAHESLLMQTPVIGTGIAGNGELLVNAGQYLCYDINGYDKAIEHVIGNRDHYVKIAQPYVRHEKFTVPYFHRQWKSIITSLADA
jgi:glycosyltransferase involved in cell wall biosynthesis